MSAARYRVPKENRVPPMIDRCVGSVCWIVVTTASTPPCAAIASGSVTTIASSMMLPLKMSIETIETMPASTVKPAISIAAMIIPDSGEIVPSERIDMKRPPPLNW